LASSYAAAAAGIGCANANAAAATRASVTIPRRRRGDRIPHAIGYRRRETKLERGIAARQTSADLSVSMRRFLVLAFLTVVGLSFASSALAGPPGPFAGSSAIVGGTSWGHFDLGATKCPGAKAEFWTAAPEYAKNVGTNPAGLTYHAGLGTVFNIEYVNDQKANFLATFFADSPDGGHFVVTVTGGDNKGCTPMPIKSALKWDAVSLGVRSPDVYGGCGTATLQNDGASIQLDLTSCNVPTAKPARLAAPQPGANPGCDSLYPRARTDGWMAMPAVFGVADGSNPSADGRRLLNLWTRYHDAAGWKKGMQLFIGSMEHYHAYWFFCSARVDRQINATLSAAKKEGLCMGAMTLFAKAPDAGDGWNTQCASAFEKWQILGGMNLLFTGARSIEGALGCLSPVSKFAKGVSLLIGLAKDPKMEGSKLAWEKSNAMVSDSLTGLFEDGAASRAALKYDALAKTLNRVKGYPTLATKLAGYTEAMTSCIGAVQEGIGFAQGFSGK